MKKPGQPDSATELTAGRKTLLGALRLGIADREQMAMAANWLRDLTVYHGESLKRLEGNALYVQMMRGALTTSVLQNHTADWIEGLVTSNPQENTNVNEDELIRQGMRATLPGANDRQVAGDHYNKRPIQHWDFVAGHDYGYLEGQVTKYLFRWRDKNGRQDLEKAAHFLQKLAEVAEADNAPIQIREFLDANQIPPEEQAIYIALHAYHGTLDPSFLDYAQAAMAALLAKA